MTDSLFFFGHRTCGISLPWSGLNPCPLALELRGLNRWTAREVSCISYYIAVSHIITFKRPTWYFKFQKPHKTEKPIRVCICICGLPWWLGGKESTCQCRRHGLDPWVRKILWRRKWQLILVFLPGKSHGQRNLSVYRPWGLKESDMTEWLDTHTIYYHKFPCFYLDEKMCSNVLFVKLH